MKYRLVVADVLEFEAKFSLQDKGKARNFGMRLTADRVSPEQAKREEAEGRDIGEFLASRNLRMHAWIGDSPLVNAETDEPVPPGAEALQAAYDVIPGAVGVVYGAYLTANSAKGRQGN